MSNSKLNSYVSDKKNTYSCRNVFQIFLNFCHDVKKWCFDVFSSEVPLWCHTADPPPLGFIVIDHLRAGEVPPTVIRSPVQHQSEFQSVSRSGTWGLQVLSWAHSVNLSKWIAGTALFWENSQSRSALLHTKQILGEVSLDLANARSKTEWTQVLDSPPGPGSIRNNVFVQTPSDFSALQS